MSFTNELDFEKAIIKVLTTECGWKPEVIKYPTEEDLIANWAKQLFEINNEVDLLNNCPLTDGEIAKLMSEINSTKTPLALNQLINGRTISIKRDNHDDKLHFGKYVSLKIYNRLEIAGGTSRYQIVEQPIFKTNNSVYPSRRGDLMLLINGLPVFHIELKKSGVPIKEAETQIEKYMNNNAFTGIFSLVQVFISMTPEEAHYFANPGPNGKFNPKFFFHWADFNNEPINEWQLFCKSFLSIPRAHQIIGFYTIADKTDNILKVMRSYQIYAAEAITNKVHKSSWTKANQPGGFIWHTTGSGKTLTSFKTAQLINDDKIADKVLFLIDRTELGTQSFIDYKGYANSNLTINSTEDTNHLLSLLKSNNEDESLIVTSIQKMSRINSNNTRKGDLEKIQSKKIVFIIDECHRDQAGEMHQTIKKTFPNAIFFGFTGTPDLTYTKDIFGDELHRYTIVNGIKDKNVLGLDPVAYRTFSDSQLQEEVALFKSNSKDKADAMSNPNKKKIYLKYMNLSPLDAEREFKKITSGNQYSPMSDSNNPTKHMVEVVKAILDGWIVKSCNYKFHGIFATNSIKEAIIYYNEFKRQQEERGISEKKLRITAVFDSSDNNNDLSIFKMDGITDIINDYNLQYTKQYQIGLYDKFKKDVCNRLAHKEDYVNIKEKDKLDLVIVVDQLLTGFDSKWINILYLDKLLEGKNLIQALSRTNRLCDDDKEFGILEWFRYPNIMDLNLREALRQYSGRNEFGIFVNKLGKNIEGMNTMFHSIEDIFKREGIPDFSAIFTDPDSIKTFICDFVSLVHFLKSAKFQGFTWDQSEYNIEENGVLNTYSLDFDEFTFDLILQRYKDLFGGSAPRGDGLSFDINSTVFEMKGTKIDSSYVNSKFTIYVKDLFGGNPSEKENAETQIHNIFATLSVEKQKYAELFLHDLQAGNVKLEDGKGLEDYIADYMVNDLERKIDEIAERYGLDREKLKNLKQVRPSASDIDSYGRYTSLMSTANIDKIVAYYSALDGVSISRKNAMQRCDEDLRKFLLQK